MNKPASETVTNDTIRAITQELTGYQDLWRYIFDSPTGRYDMERILHELERYINYLEKVTPAIRQWTYAYLEENRGKLWLYEGIHQYRDPPRDMLARVWPFLYAQPCLEYKGFVIDRDEVVKENQRKEERRHTQNPNYTLPQDAYSLWCFEDDKDAINQWRNQEEAEEKASRNIHINYRLLTPCYEAMLPEVDALKEQWATWEPSRWPYRDTYSPPPPIQDGAGQGASRAQTAYDWLRIQFHYSEAYGFRVDSYKDTYLHLFHSLWNMEDTLEKRIENRRTRLMMVQEYLNAPEPQPPISNAPIE